jgi:putative ABC transport system permease protein
MLRFALRNLLQSKVRLVMATGGVALAIMLILALDAIFSGVEEQITAYIDHSGADIWVSQAGVRNMHMSSSALPSSVTARVQPVPGVERVTPVLYVSNMVEANDRRGLAYIIGLPPDATAGRPRRIAGGTALPGTGQVVIDRSIAGQLGVTIGDPVSVLGREFTVAGLSEGLAALTNSVAFIAIEDFSQLRGNTPVISFVLVEIAAGESPSEVAARIEASVPGVTAMPRADFAREERRVVRDMATDVLTIMNTIGFVIGLAVMALTVYTATLSRRREYGVLKAIGATSGHLYRAVIAQALYSIVLGFLIGLAFTLLVSALAPRIEPALALAITPASLLKAGTISVVIAVLAAVLPIRQIAGLDPAQVFRKGTS